MSKDILSIALVQSDITWEDKAANLLRMDKALSSAGQRGKIDLAVFPELMSTGFSTQVEALAEPPDGPTIRAIKNLAQQHDVAIVSSLFICEAEQYLNRGYIVHPDGRLDYQDKRHLFRMGGEAKMISPALKRHIIDFYGWHILLSICYDLRFPVWCRNVENEYDLLLNIANWPEPRAEVFDILLRARAMENAAYVVGANRVGLDAQGLPHRGGSVAINPRGQVISAFDSDQEGIRIFSLEREPLNKFRRKFPVWMDSDSFTLHTEEIPALQ